MVWKFSIKSLLVAMVVVASLAPLLIKGWKNPLLLVFVLVLGICYAIILELPKLIVRIFNHDLPDKDQKDNGTD